MESPTSSDPSLDASLRQQEVVAELGRTALETDDFDRLVGDAVDAVADALAADYVDVLERSPDEDEVAVCDGVGWQADVVGVETVPTDGDVLPGHVLRGEGAVVVDDHRSEDRFVLTDVFARHDVTSSASVRVGPADDPWGVLEAHATEPGAFDDHDATFLASVANVLASAVRTRRAEGDHEEAYGRISDAFFALDEEWRFTHLNQRAHDLINPQGRPLEGEHVREAVPDALGRRLETEYERAMPDQETVSFEDYYPEPLDAWFEVRAYPSETGLSVYVRDVTERKRAQQQLEEERDMFAQGPVVVFRWDPHAEAGWPVEYVSENVEDVFGYTPEELESGDVPYTDLLLDEELDRIAREVEENSDDSTERFSHEPYRVKTKDGEIRWVKDVTKIVRDESGEITNYLGYLVDITERKDREQELRRYETIVESVNDGVYVVDDDQRFTMVNEAYAEMLGYDRADLLGEHVSMVTDDAVVDHAREVETAMQAGTTDDVVVEAELVTADGDRVPAEATFAMLPTPDGTVRRAGVVRDISDRKERERELEESRRRYQALVDNFPNGAVALVDEDLRYQATGGTPVDVEADTADDLAGKTVREAMSPELGDVLAPKYRAALDGESSTFEYQHSGNYSRFHIFPVRDEDGEVFAAMGMSQDVTERKERERKLAESERRYRTLVENFPDGAVGLFNHDLEYTAVGGEFLDRVGLTPEDRVGSTVSSIYPPELVEEVEPHFRAALEGEANTFETEYHDRHLLANTLPVRGADDEVLSGMLVVQDISDRKQMEEELRESEAKFRMLAENLEEIVWMASPEADEFIYINPAFERVWGLDREQLYEEPMSFLEAVHEADRDRVREGFDALPETEFDDEFRIVRPDGEVRWVYARGDKVATEDGEMVRIVGIGDDVTEQVERERELERALDLLERTERIADVGGWEIDPSTQDVFWTDHVFELLGVEADEEPPLEEALDMYHEADKPVVEDAVETALATGDPFDVEVRIRTADGEIRWLRLQGVPDVEDGEVVSFRGAAQDVTERKRREQQLEELVDKLEASNERLEQFAYAASHDLQEPLRMVSSYLQLVEDRYADELDADGREFIEFAVDGADRMREMIDGLLRYSRVDTRGDPFEPVDLDEVFAEVRQDLQVKIEESDAEITVGDLPRVEGDGGQLSQVFQNLLSNAIEYSGDEPPRIHVAAERRETANVPEEAVPEVGTGGNEWVISVSDEGIGIDPGDVDQIFEVFESLHGREDHDGTGIGLALVERIVERHGGEIWVDSEPGEGATFSFTLPEAGGNDE